MTIRRPCRAFAAALALCCGSAAAVENRPFSQRLVDDAAKLVKAGDLRGALGKFREAYAAAPDREILFNIGVTYEVLAERGGGPDDMRLGIDSFERYLKTRPPRAADRAEARASLAKLREMLFKATGERPKQVERKLPRKVHASRVRCETPDGKMAEPASLKQPATAAPLAPVVRVPEVGQATQAIKPAATELPQPATPKQGAAHPAAPAPPTPVSARWPAWRLSLTSAAAAIGVTAFGVGIWQMTAANDLSQVARSLREDDPTSSRAWKITWWQVDRAQLASRIFIAIGGTAILAALVAAIVPQFSSTRIRSVTAWIAPSSNGLVVFGSFW